MFFGCNQLRLEDAFSYTSTLLQDRTVWIRALDTLEKQWYSVPIFGVRLEIVEVLMSS